MEWTNLETFLALYRQETFAGAARALNVSPTTVSRRIERLSSDVGAVLFQRSNDGLVPTAAAETILPGAVAMERQAALIQRRMSGDETRLEGVVRLATAPEFMSHFLVDHLRTLQERHPRLELQLVLGHGLVDLSSGQADLAIRFGRTTAGIPLSPTESPDSVVGRMLGPAAIAAVASTDYLQRMGRPKPGESFAGHHVILPMDAANLPGMDYLRERMSDAHVALRCDSLAALTEAAACGLGITVTPMFMLPRFPSLEVIDPEIDGRASWLLMSRDLRRMARVRAVRDFLVELYLRWGEYLGGAIDDPPEPLRP